MNFVNFYQTRVDHERCLCFAVRVTLFELSLSHISQFLLSKKKREKALRKGKVSQLDSESRENQSERRNHTVGIFEENETNLSAFTLSRE